MIRAKFNLCIPRPTDYLKKICEFKSAVMFETGNGSMLNAKSLLSVLAVDLHHPKEIKVLINGPDEEKVIDFFKSL